MEKYFSNLLGATMAIDGNAKAILFYGGIFSQWADCEFYIPDLKHKVNCAEQGMMLYKAREFNDTETFDRILNSSHPREQKLLGRTVKNYNEDIWAAKRFDYVVDVNFHKFSQSFAWKELLIFSTGWEIIEASPTDRIWGIGLGENSVQNLTERNNWGQNLLGKAIMMARDKIRGNV